ncbi:MULTISPECIES: hypothetical protein [unclassified Staphylococcus]|uniref:hypothetical protein n=1 Tax=unclassified Staphylococcus TaxID=91994 RepID=UPI0021CECD1D|nr:MULTISPECIES: hypothetical protein [unclassified Staphylococcus]UXR77700.1 hypothetical protein MUA92_07440 [Staphylococcus sp. IVB6227]UXR81856.1 hypothetical protein MUA51_07130 [Staphylococcus sp. IVB6214]
MERNKFEDITDLKKRFDRIKLYIIYLRHWIFIGAGMGILASIIDINKNSSYMIQIIFLIFCIGTVFIIFLERFSFIRLFQFLISVS